MNAAVMPGCEAVSHRVGAEVGVALLHGFTGNPFTMRGVADAMISTGLDVEVPRLPGHGTVIDDMVTTVWADWAAEANRAIDDLADRCDRVVALGQSMGATLALAAALDRPQLAGLVCINPATRGRDAETMAMLDEFIDDGLHIVPGEGSDVADPEASDGSYSGTPLAPVRSLAVDGIAPITGRFGELQMPLRLFTSRNDHVIDPGDSEHLAATYGGAVEHTWLDRSYHVATIDYDRELVASESVAFVQQVVS